MFRQLKQAISNALAAPGRFIEACNTLTEATRQQTKALGVISCDAVLHHQESVQAIAGVEKHLKYLAASERNNNQRAGHKVKE
jgi:hypothetical protein